MTVSQPHTRGPASVVSRSLPFPKFAPYLATAILVAIPSVWQQHIQADDLSSHLYNAWLGNQAAAGALPGLYVVPQYTNVLFDLLLSSLVKSGSVILTERVAVVLAAQIFFWGCFALVSAAGRRPAWTMTPFLGLLSYGAIFRMGFFNFYISVGICCAAIALVWWNHPRKRWLAVPLLLAALTAHFLPCLWAIVVIGYLIAARRLEPSRRRWLAGAGLAAVCGLAFFLAKYVASRWASGLRVDSLFGADQVLTFGMKYKFVAIGLLCCWILLLIRRLDLAPQPLNDLAFLLWVVMAAAALLMPDSIWLPFYTGGLSFISVRLSLFSGILLCAAVASVPMRKFAKILASSLLALFLAFSYADEQALNSFQQKIAQALVTLPPGARVIAPFEDSRLYVQALNHIADVPCIGHCFDFANYEPATSQFRLRARSGNTYVISDYDQLGDLERDRYVFARTDISLYRLSVCGPGEQICASRVKAGEQIKKQALILGSQPWGL